MRRRRRAPTYRLRMAVHALPPRTREAMLRGIEANRIVVGAYVDPGTGGVCPMLAAHRNGGRTSVAGFARAWDAYTNAKRPRLATRREVRTLRGLLEQSLSLEPAGDGVSIAELARQIRAEREQFARCAAPAPISADGPDEHPSGDATLEPPALDLLAIAESALADEGSWKRVDAGGPASDPSRPEPFATEAPDRG